MTNIAWRWDKFGHKESDTIDTHKEYTHAVSFQSTQQEGVNDSSVLSKIENTLTQGDHTYTYDSCNREKYFEVESS
jgi:hypothetical protein